MQKVKGQLLQVVESINPVKDIVFENFEQEILIRELSEKICKQKKEIENQKRYKRNKEFISRNNFSTRVYYYRDNQNNPRITVYIIYDKKDNKYYRGISFCSFQDMVNKEEGRDIAEDRAIKAIKMKENNNRISRKEVSNILKNIKHFDIKNLEFKSEYNIKPTNFEKQLFSTKKRS